MKITLAADKMEIGMGRNLALTATATLADGTPASGSLLLPYVDGKRWGAHERANAQGQATFLLPLPMPGVRELQVEAWPGETTHRPEVWIWSPELKADQQVFLQGSFDLPAAPTKAQLWLGADDEAVIYVNGQRIAQIGHWLTVGPHDVAALLHPGKNIISVEARTGSLPAGVLARLNAETPSGPVEFLSSEAWRSYLTAPAGWPNETADAGTPAKKISTVEDGVWRMEEAHWPGLEGRPPLFAGTRLAGTQPVSEPLAVRVNWRKLQPPPADPAHEVMLQWEPWFSPNAVNWNTAQGVPLMGYYWSYLPEVTRQHVIWSVESGVDIFLADWTNHLWDKKHWDERPDGAQEIVHCTTVALEEMARMRDEGIPVPKMVLLVSVCNGPTTTMEAVNEMMTWVYHNYVRNPRFKDLFYIYDGKPLVVNLSGFGPQWLTDTHQVPADETHFTYRWMASQNDITKLHEKGYWSWMDGSLKPMVTMREGKPEMETVCAAFFSSGGWLAPTAYGHRGGWTYIESMKDALKVRPRLIQLHQFNEFAGQPEGAGYGPEKNVFLDSYSNEFSDDLEPVSLTAPAYRSPNGGWGYYYLNLTRALIDLYRQPAEAPETTVVALSAPLNARTLTGNSLDLVWTTAGHPATGFTVEVNGQPALTGLVGTQAKLDLTPYPNGPLKIRLIAEGTKARYRLSYTEDSLPLEQLEPASVEVDYTLQR